MNLQSIKALVKELTPPILLKYLKKSKSSSRIYGSYEDAMKMADGYEDKILTRVQVAKGKKFSEQISETKELDLTFLRIFAGLASALDKNKLTVIDFGGAAGTYYSIAKSILPENIELDWRIVETSAMVAEAKKQSCESDELHFFCSLDVACEDTEVDLVFASGSVQYTPQPYDALRALASINAKILMITRTPITDSPCVILQRSTLSGNGLGEIPKELKINDKVVSYPVTMMDRKRVEEILSIFGDIRLKISEDKAAYRSDKGSYDMWGYIVSKVN
jgi:putative methyltransferase (TIGR04325 family)